MKMVTSLTALVIGCVLVGDAQAWCWKSCNVSCGPKSCGGGYATASCGSCGGGQVSAGCSTCGGGYQSYGQASAGCSTCGQSAPSYAPVHGAPAAGCSSCGGSGYAVAGYGSATPAVAYSPSYSAPVMATAPYASGTVVYGSVMPSMPAGSYPVYGTVYSSVPGTYPGTIIPSSQIPVTVGPMTVITPPAGN